MKQTKNFLLTFSSALFFFFAGCEDDVIGDPPPPPSVSKGIIVINEGVFGQNNAGITYHNFENGSTTQNIYASANSGSALGDNANSIFTFNGKGYIAVDNSNKIEIVDLSNFKSLGFINLGAGGSPREIIILDSTTGYVTSLYSNSVIKFNPSTKSAIKNISVGNYPEGIVHSSGKLFVANSGFGNSNTISVIDVASDAVVKTLQVAANPRIMFKDNAGNVYAVCSGLYTDSTGRGGIFKISSSTATVTDSIIVYKNPGEAALVDNNTIIVVNNNGAFKVNLASRIVADTAFVSSIKINPTFGVIYSIAYDELRGKLYFGNPKDFQQNGELVEFDLNGKELNRIPTGINPGTIHILK